MILFGFSYSVSAESEKTMIYFYSSESNINNFKSLKIEFDSYLTRFGAYEFQPFSDREAFENHIKGKKNFILILSSWHFLNIYKEYSLKPELIGVRNGKNHQKRILITAGNSFNIDAIKAGPIASASSIPHTRNVLKDILKGNSETVRVLTVPKDIDALMSLEFGMSQAALIIENSIEKLKIINPVFYSKLNILAECKPSLLLLSAVPESFTKDAENIIQYLQNMASDPKGKNIINMVGLDDWLRNTSLDIFTSDNWLKPNKP